MLEVMSALRSLRLGGGSVFAAKHSVITVRDLMKWASRVATQVVPDEMKNEMALQGYYLFGERVRTADEREQVKEVLKKKLKIGNLEEQSSYETYFKQNLQKKLQAI